MTETTVSKEKAIDKVRKLMALADKERNSNDNEAQAAMLRAQELMIQYGIVLKEVDLTEAKPEADWNIPKVKGAYAAWKHRLGRVIAANFRCKVVYAGNFLGFVGLKDDAEAASLMYVYALKIIDKGMYRCYRRFRDSGRYAEGVRGDYVIGFIDGLKAKFDEQVASHNWSLMLVTHPVVDEWVDKHCNKTHESKSRMVRQGNSEAYGHGYKDGKEMTGPHTQIEKR